MGRLLDGLAEKIIESVESYNISIETVSPLVERYADKNLKDWQCFIGWNFIDGGRNIEINYAYEDFEYYTAKELKLYKETNMNENKCTHCVYAVNNNHCGLRGFRSNFNVNYCSAQNVDKLPNGFELQEDGYFSWVNKKPKYPKTFEECLNMLYCKSVLRTIIGHKAELLFNLEKLLICRDAYWKIAGEEIGLDKPWEPDWNKETDKFTISNKCNKIYLINTAWYAEVLSFPTEEMRDVFYKNFKDLIELCKELL